MTQLHIDRFGSGDTAILVHGSFGWGLDTWPEQRLLGETHEVLLVDRCGYGQSSGGDELGWPADSAAIANLLEETGPAHLVGQSYGGVVSLVVAGRRPELVRSLVVIEPPAFGVPTNSEAAAEMSGRMKAVFAAAGSLTARAFADAWGAAMGRNAEQQANWVASLTDKDWAAVEATRREAWPGDAPIDFARLRDARFPKVVVTGAWPSDMAPGRERTRDAFASIADSIAERIDARRVVMEHSCHNPQIEEPVRFNALLHEVWSSAN